MKNATICCKSGNSVETWYDRHTRSWVTQTKDAEGSQIGEADYAGARESRDFNHAARVKDEGGPRRVLKLSGRMRVINFLPGTQECEGPEAED